MAGPLALRPSAGRILQSCSSPRPPMTTQVSAVAPRLASFSTTSQRCQRRTKDNNKARGVSSLYRSGPREPLSMSDIPLPKPREFKPKIEVDKNHGLWGFFPAPGKLLWTPKETEEHGRAWTVEELRRKSWEDLHSLWWVCCRERNLIATSKAELARTKLGFGERELEHRDEEVSKTQQAIKHALTERFYTWEDAVDVARSDPEVNMQGGGQAYTPSAYEDEYEPSESVEAEAQTSEGNGNMTSADPAATSEQAAKAEKEATR